MPYASDAQRRYFHANKDKLEAEGVDVAEWDEASKGKDLPERKKAKKTAMKTASILTAGFRTVKRAAVSGDWLSSPLVDPNAPAAIQKRVADSPNMQGVAPLSATTAGTPYVGSDAEPRALDAGELKWYDRVQQARGRKANAEAYAQKEQQWDASGRQLIADQEKQTQVYNQAQADAKELADYRAQAAKSKTGPASSGIAGALSRMQLPSGVAGRNPVDMASSLGVASSTPKPGNLVTNTANTITQGARKAWDGFVGGAKTVAKQLAPAPAVAKPAQPNISGGISSAVKGMKLPGSGGGVGAVPAAAK